MDTKLLDIARSRLKIMEQLTAKEQPQDWEQAVDKALDELGFEITEKAPLHHWVTDVLDGTVYAYSNSRMRVGLMILPRHPETGKPIENPDLYSSLKRLGQVFLGGVIFTSQPGELCIPNEAGEIVRATYFSKIIEENPKEAVKQAVQEKARREGRL